MERWLTVNLRDFQAARRRPRSRSTTVVTTICGPGTVTNLDTYANERLPGLGSPARRMVRGTVFDMRRWLKILTCALAVLIVAWAGPVIALNVIENKHTVDPRELVRESPEAHPLLKQLKWTVQKTDADVKGVYARSWDSGKVRLIERVHQYGSPISALYTFSTQDPLLAHEARATTVAANPPPGLRADQAEVFCSHLVPGRGHTKKCVAWNAWLRYGQYTVYVGLANAILSSADFAVITQRVDAVVNRALL